MAGELRAIEIGPARLDALEAAMVDGVRRPAFADEVEQAEGLLVPGGRDLPLRVEEPIAGVGAEVRVPVARLELEEIGVRARRVGIVRIDAGLAEEEIALAHVRGLEVEPEEPAPARCFDVATSCVLICLSCVLSVCIASS